MDKSKLNGVWSVMSTPLDDNYNTDTSAVTTLNYTMTDECSKNIDAVLAELKSYLYC